MWLTKYNKSQGKEWATHPNVRCLQMIDTKVNEMWCGRKVSGQCSLVGKCPEILYICQREKAKKSVQSKRARNVWHSDNRNVKELCKRRETQDKV